MSRSRAIRSGISILTRQPLVMVAELAWRWAFSTAVLVLGIYSLLLFLHSRLVSGGDLFGLSGIVPSLFAQTIAHIFRGSGPTIVRIMVVLAVGFSLLWWLAASWGRTATLRAMCIAPQPGSDRRKSENRKNSQTMSGAFGSIFGLHAIRVAVGFAVVLAYVGALLLAASASGMRAGVASLNQGAAAKFYFMFLLFSFLVGTIGSSLSWYFSLAPVLSVSSDKGAFASLRDAVLLSRRRSAQFLWVGFVCGLLRLLLYSATFFFLLALVGLLAKVPGGVVAGVLAVVALVYSVGSTLISMIRLAAYVRIVQWDGEEGSNPPVSTETCEAPTVTTEIEFPQIAPWEPPPTPAG